MVVSSLDRMRKAGFALLLSAAACSVYDDRLIQQPAFHAPVLAADGGVPVEPTAGHPSPSVSAGQSAAGQSAGQPAEVCHSEAVDDYCGHLPALPAEPLIDGQPDCGLRLVAIAPTGWNGATAGPITHARYAVATRPDGLYVYVEVHGSAPMPHAAGQPVFCGDAVELYVDADGMSDANGSYDMTGTMQFVIAGNPAIQLDAVRFVSGNPQGAWISKSVQSTALSDGYAIEAFITGADLGLWQWQPSGHIGFSIGIDEPGAPDPSSPRCGMQLGQYFLRVAANASATCRGEPWCDVRAFCVPNLAP
jgi:hypothetical protein